MKNKINKTMNHRCYNLIFLKRKFYLIQAHGIESYSVNSGKRLLSSGERLSYVLEVLLHLQGKNVKCVHKRQFF